MREVDKRTRVSRRVFMRGTATVVPAAAIAVAGITITPNAVWAQAAKNLKPETMATLVKVARDIYPHDRLADIYYVTAVTPYDAKAADPAFRELIEGGIERLDVDAKQRFGTTYIAIPWEEDRVTLLRAGEHSPFFQKVRSDLVVSLYNQKAVWPKFGYEGASAEYGGYINRGFNDIDWLPEA